MTPPCIPCNAGSPAQRAAAGAKCGSCRWSKKAQIDVGDNLRIKTASGQQQQLSLGIGPGPGWKACRERQAAEKSGGGWGPVRPGESCSSAGLALDRAEQQEGRQQLWGLAACFGQALLR
jgi:hypothetical protein